MYLFLKAEETKQLHEICMTEELITRIALDISIHNLSIRHLMNENIFKGSRQHIY